MEGSTSPRRPRRLRRYLEESGTSNAWLAREVGVAKSTLSLFLSGQPSLGEQNQARILAVLRERAGLPVTSELFEEDGHVGDR